MNNPCGCQTYEECWAGDCCCSTMAEKLAWAHENNIIPPDSATRLASQSCDQSDPECPQCAKKAKKKTCCDSSGADRHSSCCEKLNLKSEKHSYKVVIGIFAQKCKGQSHAGFGLLPVSIEPPQPFAIVMEVLSSERIALLNELPTDRVVSPDAPPPRV